MSPTSQHARIQRRWTDADGEKVGLWITFGVFISIVLFALILGGFNLFLNNPLKQYKQIKKENETKTSRIDDLEASVKRLDQNIAENNRTILDRASEIDRLKTLVRVSERENAAINTIHMQELENRDQIIQQKSQRITDLTCFEEEANRLRPRIGEQEDKIRELRQELDQTKAQRDDERRAKEEGQRRLAHVTAELAEFLARHEL